MATLLSMRGDCATTPATAAPGGSERSARPTVRAVAALGAAWGRPPAPQPPRTRRSCQPGGPAVHRAACWLLGAAGALGSALGVGIGVGCSSEAPAPLQVAPLGEHEVPVGATALVEVRATGGVPPLTVELGASPAGALLLTGSAGAVVAMAAVGAAATEAVGWIAWEPSRFDLAPTAPQQPRAAGAWRPLEATVRDATGAELVAAGRVRAIPGVATAP